MKTDRLVPEFVEFVPAKPEPGILYISLPYSTAVHACCCGCGRKVVTPLGPTDWKLRHHGSSVSLHPSVGNWSFPCQSHYWIRDGRILWAEHWTPERIAAGRAADKRRKDAYFEHLHRSPPPPPRTPNLWSRFWRWISQ